MMFFYVLALILYMAYYTDGNSVDLTIGALFFCVGALLNLVRWAYNR